MRQIISAIVVVLFLLLGTVLGFFALTMRSGTVPTYKIIPQSAHIVIHIPELRRHWDALGESYVLDQILNSDVFERLDEADRLQAEIDRKIHALLPNEMAAERHPSVLLDLREKLKKVKAHFETLQVDLFEGSHYWDFVGRDLSFALKYNGGSKAASWLASSVMGGRGFTLFQALRKASQKVSDSQGEMYVFPENENLYFAVLGSRCLLSNDVEFLDQALTQAADPEYTSRDKMPALSSDLVSVRVDVEGIKNLQHYRGNVFSAIKSVVMPSENPQEGTMLDWYLDFVVLGDCWHINTLKDLSLTVNVLEDRIVSDLQFTTVDLSGKKEIQNLLDIPGSSSAIGALLPESTIYYNRSQVDMDKWLRDVQRESILASKNPAEERKNWKTNLRQIDTAIAPQRLRPDVLENLGPDYGLCAIWNGADSNIPPDEMILPAAVFYIEVQPELQPTIETIFAKAIDAFLKDIDANRSKRDPNSTSSYHGIAPRDYHGTTIHDITLSRATMSEIELADGLSRNLKFGFARIDKYLFFTTNTKSLEAIIQHQTASGNGVEQKLGEERAAVLSSQDFYFDLKNFQEWYREIAGYYKKSVWLDAYDEELDELKKVHHLEGAWMDLFKTCDSYSQWTPDGGRLHFEIALNKDPK